ncbi:putative HTH-type transcriptional regulator YtcD [Mycobacterium basiliense]|uniref:Putative HTH-type transcriptional regulator YtcD n=1 Tax=Mycobacterium basiliense TaxID=2094119 RepID=A0A3S4CA33_9MYCO|nr:helix-turn-helix domain-containing protein [Mycobacterium basiliense]VDM87827.1 putative HTH-type transcriptional regulator YtcD [Mycobacterium basiliense]
MTEADLSHRFAGESVGRALELVGERWTLLILREAFFGVTRFGQLARNLNIPRPTLSARLRMLVDVGLLDRVPYSQDPQRHEYRLTEAGHELFAAIVVLMRWGDEHLPHPDGPPIVLRHHPCGQFVDARLICTHCGDQITARNVTPEPGPGVGTNLASPAASHDESLGHR